MSPTRESLHAEELLAHAAWVRRLAYKLVFDANKVDDVVQEAWLKMLKSPPSEGSNVRGWMAAVVTNVARTMGRSESRRKRHESAVERGPSADPTDDIVAQAALQRDLVGQVLKLDEPYRTVLLLRFFEDLAPRQIARRTGRSVATVKTQVHRGLAILRQGLDGKYGDRRSWALMLLPLAKGGSTVGIGSILLVAAASVTLTVAGVALWRSWDSARNGLPARGDVVADLVERRETVAPVLPRTVRGADPGDARVEVPAAAQAPSQEASEGPLYILRGRTVDSSGALLSGARLVWDDPRVLAWEDERELTIVGRNFWLPISPQKRAALRSSPAELEAFAAASFSAPQLGKALLLDEDPPVIEVESGPEGDFELEVPVSSDEVRSGDPRTTVVAQGRSSAFGEEERIVLVCPTALAEGTVLRPSGEPVANAEVAVHAYLLQLPDFPHRVDWKRERSSWKTKTDVLGRYRLPGLPTGVPLWIQATKDTGWSPSARFDPAGPPLILVLTSEPLAPTVTLVGRVVHADGTVAARATVATPGKQTTTDAEGRFELGPTELHERMVLVAAKPGHGAVFREGLAAELGRQGRQAIADLVLPNGPEKIAGIVIDAAGVPQEGFEVELVDPTNANGLWLEQLVGGHRGSVTTGTVGSFTLGVLPDRDYHLRARRASRIVWTEAVRAGTQGLEIVIDEVGSWPRVSGLVTDSAGRPLAGIGVRAQLVRRNNGPHDSVTLGSTSTGSDGRFVLTDVPHGRSRAFSGDSVGLLLSNDEAPWYGPSLTRWLQPQDAVEDLHFILPLWCRFRLEAGVHPVSSIEVLKEDGEALDIYTFDGPNVQMTSRLNVEETSPVCHVEDAAAMLVLHRKDGESQSLPIRLAPGRLEVIRP